jgi:hypothetical protein
MTKKRDGEELRLIELEPDLPAVPAATPLPMDAAESRWDPWLIALAQLEVAAQSPPN